MATNQTNDGLRSQSSFASEETELQRLSDARRSANGTPSMLKTQEHVDLVAMFERAFKIKGRCAEKETRDQWSQGHIYQHGPTNELFLAYRHGYAYGKTVHQ